MSYSLKLPASAFLATLVLLSLGCGSPETSKPLPEVQVVEPEPLAQEEIATVAEATAELVEAADPATLPAIPMGRSAFHATDPATVVLASGQVQLIEFFAYWCSVCKAVAPTVHGLEELYSEQINFVYLDRDDPATESLRNQLGYIYQPHFFLLAADGTILGQWRGYVEGPILQQALVDAIN